LKREFPQVEYVSKDIAGKLKDRKGLIEVAERIHAVVVRYKDRLAVFHI